MVNCLFIFYAIHFVLFGMINDADKGARCVKDNEYPVVYQLYFTTWLCFFFLALYFYLNDFFMDKDLIKQQDERDIQFENKILEFADDDYKRMYDKDGDGIADRFQMDKDGDGDIDEDDFFTTSKVLRKMVNRFALFHSFFFFYVVGLLYASFGINNQNKGWLMCNVGQHGSEDYDPSLDVEDDQDWIPSKIGGTIISLSHVIMIMMGSVQAEQAFYTVPHHIGFYEIPDPDFMEDFVLEEAAQKEVKSRQKGSILTDVRGFLQKKVEKA